MLGNEPVLFNTLFLSGSSLFYKKDEETSRVSSLFILLWDESAKVGCRVSANIIGIIGHKLESSLCTRTGTALLSPSLARSRD